MTFFSSVVSLSAALQHNKTYAKTQTRHKFRKQLNQFDNTGTVKTNNTFKKQ